MSTVDSQDYSSVPPPIEAEQLDRRTLQIIVLQLQNDCIIALLAFPFDQLPSALLLLKTPPKF